MKIALVHDWLTSRGGAERVLFDMHRMWPHAPIYTSVFDRAQFPEFADADVRTTWIDRIGLARRKHQLFSLPRTGAFSRLDLSEFDVVVSLSHAEAKYVLTSPRTLHICYCFTPVRYYWSDYDWYRAHPPFGGLNPVAKLVFPALVRRLRRLDYEKAQHVDRYVTSARYVAERISRYYDREATVIHPGTDTERFAVTKEPHDYYLVVGRQVAYKRLDIAVDAFNSLGLPLVVVGTGEEIPRNRARAKSNITFRGRVSEEELPHLYANAKALVHPQEEDYGLGSVEAQAAGTPVIAYGVGGAAETVVDGRTGLLYGDQSAEGLVEAVRRFEQLRFDPVVLRTHARRFDTVEFETQLRGFVDAAYASHVA